MKKFGPNFWSHVSILSVCVCLVFEVITTATDSWYIRHDDVTKAVHNGGLWSRCVTEAHARTMCTPIKKAETWLHVARICVVVSTCVTIASIMYMMRSMAQRETNLSVMIGVNTFKCVVFLVGVVVYTVKGFAGVNGPGTSFYVAWVTYCIQLSTTLVWFYSYVRLGKLSQLQVQQSESVM